MGLGKTLQVISFIDVLLRNTEAHTVLAIVPVSISSVDCSIKDNVVSLGNFSVPLTLKLSFLHKGKHAPELVDRV